MPARNEALTAHATLQSVYASTRLPDEIIVGDGRSTDGTRERLVQLADPRVPLRVVDNPGILPGAGRNVAAQASTAEVLLLLDFGNRIGPRFIEEMMRCFEEDPSLDMVGGAILPLVANDYERCVAAIQFGPQCRLARQTPQERLRAAQGRLVKPGGLSVGFTRELWDRLGGMPDWLRTAEDKVFGRKVMASSPRVALSAAAELFHHMRSSPGEIYHQMFTYLRGDGRTGQVSGHCLRLAGFYGALLALALVALVWPPAVLLLLVIASAYLYRSGFRKLAILTERPPAWKRFYLVPAVIFPRDLGILAGQLRGTLDWLLEPRYRERLTTYLGSAPPGR